MASIDRYYLSACSQAAKAQNVNVEELAKLAGINPHSQKRINDFSMQRFLNYLVKATDDAFLGFASRNVDKHFFAFLIQSLFYCRSISEVIVSLTKGLALADCDLQVQHDGDQLSLIISHNHNDSQHFLSEYILVFIHRVMSWSCGKSLKLQQAHIRYQPTAYEDEFALLFRCPICVDQPHNGLVFNADILQFPMVRQQAEYAKTIAQFPLIVLRFPGEESLFDRQVQRLIDNHFNQHNVLPTATQVAAQLGISTATLRRKLAHLLTSFGQLKEEFRKTHAMQLLQHSTLSIEAIADQLSYSEARAFSRVFKQWTGLTPSQYRRKKL